MELRASTRKQLRHLKANDLIYFDAFTSTTAEAPEMAKQNSSTVAQVAKFFGESRGRDADKNDLTQYDDDGKLYKDGTLLIIIDIKAQHYAGVSISSLSEIEDEDEVLLSCFTRFRVLKVVKKDENSDNDNDNDNDGDNQDNNFATEWELYLETVEPKYKGYKHFEKERNIRENFGIACTSFDFASALQICHKYRREIPNLVNSVRPSSSKCYTALHQASWQRNDLAINELKNAGANVNVWNHKGQTPLQTYNA